MSKAVPPQEPKTTPRVLLVSGTSGAGKTTLAKQLLNDEHFGRAITATTRTPRGDEAHGTHYYFYPMEEFLRREQAGEFLETAEVYGHRYGTPRDSVKDVVKQGRHCILVIDVQGFLTLDDSGVLAELSANVVTVFVRTPDLETLAKRLRERGEDDESAIARRLAHAKAELAFAERFDFVVVNDEIAKAETQIRRIATGPVPTKTPAANDDGAKPK